MNDVTRLLIRLEWLPSSAAGKCSNALSSAFPTLPLMTEPVQKNKSSSHEPELKTPRTQANLLLIGQWLDLFNHQGARTTPLKDLAAGGDLLPSKRQQPFVLPRRRRGVGNRPVDGAVVR